MGQRDASERGAIRRGALGEWPVSIIFVIFDKN